MIGKKVMVGLTSIYTHRKNDTLPFNVVNSRSISNSALENLKRAFREKYQLHELGLNPDEIWGDIRDQTFAGGEVIFE
ncbi:hypothetical protein [Microcoleus vaginatus]|uniref:hypothetical protein n=1 Tax=Microcoleus vaginatus TaxID=119532 RepID=UPI001F61BC4C|nr:hypothetical protein D0A37_23200 [Microcoleus vaginatus HSN003]